MSTEPSVERAAALYYAIELLGQKDDDAISENEFLKRHLDRMRTVFTSEQRDQATAGYYSLCGYPPEAVVG